MTLKPLSSVVDNPIVREHEILVPLRLIKPGSAAPYQHVYAVINERTAKAIVKLAGLTDGD